MSDRQFFVTKFILISTKYFFFNKFDCKKLQKGVYYGCKENNVGSQAYF
ncbi:hypothetical protein PTL465_06850 [Ligilactobacillus agilis]|nr:hypothetical protein PTL465_06850 [Ligilactobacillus agilis]